MECQTVGRVDKQRRKRATERSRKRDRALRLLRGEIVDLDYEREQRRLDLPSKLSDRVAAIEDAIAAGDAQALLLAAWQAANALREIPPQERLPQDDELLLLIDKVAMPGVRLLPKPVDKAAAPVSSLRRERPA